MRPPRNLPTLRMRMTDMNFWIYKDGKLLGAMFLGPQIELVLRNANGRFRLVPVSGG